MRFYRTSNPVPVDYMYRINAPLMEKVVLKNDEYINQRLADASKVDELANFDHLLQDEEDAKQVTKQYQDQAEQIAEAIRQDPANWRKFQPTIEKLKKNLINDYRSGAISKYTMNYQRRKGDFDKIDKQVELYNTSGGSKGISPQRANAWKNYYDSQFEKTGYDPANPSKYNVYKGGSVMDDIDIKKVLGEGLDKIKADKDYRYHEDVTGKGWYFNKETNKTEEVTPDRVLRIAMDNINPNLMNYLKGEQQVGLMKGVFDPNTGEFIQPFSQVPHPITPQEQAQVDKIQTAISRERSPKIREELRAQLKMFQDSLTGRTRMQWNDESPLTPALRGLMNQYSYRDVEQGNDLSYNPAQGTIYNAQEAWKRQTRQLTQAKEIADANRAAMNDRFAERLKLDKYKWDNPHTTGKGTTTTTKPGEIPKPPTEAQVGKTGTNSFESMTTNDYFNPSVKHPTYSVAGLTSDIRTYKEKVANTEKVLKTIDAALATNPDNAVELKETKATLEAQLVHDNSLLTDRRTAYKIARDKAFEILTPEEKKLYEEYAGKDEDFTALKNQIKSLEKEYPDIIQSDAEHTLRTTQQPVLEARAKLRNLISTKNKLNNIADKVLEDVRREYFQTNTIKPTEKESQAIQDIIVNNPVGLEIFDSNSANIPQDKQLDLPGTSWFNRSGDNLSMTFAQGQLAKYIKDTHTKVIVQDVGASTAIGNGNAIMKVRFDDPNGEIPKDKDFFIVLDKDQQQDVANIYRNHKNPEIARLAYDLADDFRNNIFKQLATSKNTKEFDILVPRASGSQLPVHIKRTDSGHLIASVKDKETGENLYFPSPDGEHGLFNGPDHLITALKVAMLPKPEKK